VGISESAATDELPEFEGLTEHQAKVITEHRRHLAEMQRVRGVMD
jgi:hypothetical protein